METPAPWLEPSAPGTPPQAPLAAADRQRGDRSPNPGVRLDPVGAEPNPVAPGAPLLAEAPHQATESSRAMLRTAETILRDTLLQSAEEGGALLRLDPGGAKLSLRETGAGGISLDLRMHQGTLDIKASGSAASLLSSHENDLRAALLGAGLRLGQLSVASPNRPVAAAAVAEADEAKRRTRTEQAQPKIGRPGSNHGTHHAEAASEEGATASVHIKA